MNIGKLINELIDYYHDININITIKGIVRSADYSLCMPTISTSKDNTIVSGVELCIYDDNDNLIYDSNDVMTIPSIDAIFLLKWKTVKMWIGHANSNTKETNCILIDITKSNLLFDK